MRWLKLVIEKNLRNVVLFFWLPNDSFVEILMHSSRTAVAPIAFEIVARAKKS